MLFRSINVLLPQWGMGMNEGIFTKWYKSVGDDVSENEPLAEIETQKSSEILESPSAGKIIEILAKEGDTIPVRSVVAIIETN